MATLRCEVRATRTPFVVPIQGVDALSKGLRAKCYLPSNESADAIDIECDAMGDSDVVGAIIPALDTPGLCVLEVRCKVLLHTKNLIYCARTHGE